MQDRVLRMVVTSALVLSSQLASPQSTSPEPDNSRVRQTEAQAAAGQAAQAGDPFPTGGRSPYMDSRPPADPPGHGAGGGGRPGQSAEE